MSKRTKLAVFIGALAAVVSAVVVVLVYWDKLLAMCPCHKKCSWDGEDALEAEPEAEAVTYAEDELQDFADLDKEEAAAE